MSQPTPGIRFFSLLYSHKVGYLDPSVARGEIDLSWIWAVRNNPVIFESDPLAQVFVCMGVDPGAFAVTSSVSRLRVAVRLKLSKDGAQTPLFFERKFSCLLYDLF
jgi:hypothetical protein